MFLFCRGWDKSPCPVPKNCPTKNAMRRLLGHEGRLGRDFFHIYAHTFTYLLSCIHLYTKQFFIIYAYYIMSYMSHNNK